MMMTLFLEMEIVVTQHVSLLILMEFYCYTSSDLSDAALKSDITTIDNALEKVANMRGVFFNKDGERGTGVVAQEVQKLLEAVFEGGEYLSVAYGNLVGVLVEAIKDLKQVEELKMTLEVVARLV